jgi:thioesterase domain-containing protein
MENSGVERAAVYELGLEAVVGEAAVASDIIGLNLDGGRPPLFLIQSWKDEIPKIQRLARLMGPDQPIVGINPPRGEDRDAFPRRAEVWVDFCLERLDRLKYTGPWKLGGWSFGGTLSVGVGEVLAERGDEVQLLLLIDSSFPRSPTVTYSRKNMSFVQRAVRSASDFYDVPVADRESFLKEKMMWWRVKARRWLLGEKKQWLEERKSKMDLLQRALHVSYLNYVPTYSTSRIFLMWTDESIGKTKDLSLGWRRHHRGPFLAKRVAAGHVSLWDDPDIEGVATLTKEALAWEG